MYKYIDNYLELKIAYCIDIKHAASSFKERHKEELDLPCQQDVVQEIVSYYSRREQPLFQVQGTCQWHH